MLQQDIDKILDQLLSLPGETECVEFKEARDNYDFDELGSYFSALSNEANLKSKPCGWLVLGVDNSQNIVGTNYKRNPGALDSLKHAISQHTTSNLTFIEIHEVIRQKGRIVMFEIPLAPRGIPIAWKRHYYARDGESLVGINIDKLERIRGQSLRADWSQVLCEGASLDVLGPEAMKVAKERYRDRHNELASEMETWDEVEFLNKARLAIQGNLTNAAVILLGKPESAFLLPSPYAAQVNWVLKDEADVEKDYFHFGPPLLLNVEALFARIRNLTVRYMPDGTLFPIELKQYDSWVIREALHNCIAHQDYSMDSRIAVVEKPGELIFDNAGSFIPRSIESLLSQDAPPQYYRNQFLTLAMRELGMIDTVGSGIRRMFREQKERCFPLPDYDLSDPDRVTVRISGRILNENFTNLLLNHEELDLQTVILLDKVQKGLRLSRDEHRKLKAKGLVEGRFPNIFISSELAAAARRKAAYIKYRAFDDKYYKDMILSFLEKNERASRLEIDQLLANKLSDALDEKQKRTKVSNLLQSMSQKDKTIINAGSRKIPKWVLAKSDGDRRDSS